MTSQRLHLTPRGTPCHSQVFPGMEHIVFDTPANAGDPDFQELPPPNLPDIVRLSGSACGEYRQ